MQRILDLIDVPTGGVLVTGCFDILHRGHVLLLEHAHLLARTRPVTLPVCVGLNSDFAIRELKGPDRPRNDFESRSTLMAAIRFVDYVFEIKSTRVTQAINVTAPKIWLKGGDYTMETLDQSEVLAAQTVGAEISIFRTIGNYSTTNILKK